MSGQNAKAEISNEFGAGLFKSPIKTETSLSIISVFPVNIQAVALGYASHVKVSTGGLTAQLGTTSNPEGFSVKSLGLQF